MHCDYFSAGRCRSCRLMGVPYHRQLADKQVMAAQALRPVAPEVRWADPFASAESGYRNKAKWVVGGDRRNPTIGILDERREGIDLRRCGICEPSLIEAFPALVDFIARIGLVPYDVNRRIGDIKYLIVTTSPQGQLLVRFVLRSLDRLDDIRRGLPALRSALPQLAVASVNLHPEHKAVLEGDREILLTEESSLSIRLGDVSLYLGPQGFFQTNTAVAAGLYRQAADWATQTTPTSVLDLYCGIGGFALHCAPPSARTVHGVEISADAVSGARRSAATRPDPGRFTFDADDAVARRLDADLVIVNPPRRGLGATVADWIDTGAARHLIYSSCNPATLAADLARMPSLRAIEARLFDMFPQTAHMEVAVLLERR
ncbi:23S rRNA m(5)U-747 methyltransferase [Nakamurella panacisegetis]|uniref:23S rRNA m(5)U-747 methyltransferase n=1 Tax=Nakamurella panacisegetis TaxID=1090615 RepID=A0A1H0T7F1_9ACTN|nr:methyltransferase domain-containing protein [Nakamurella panacisegetis]SDP49640.1 23S rRNA m(5)U-747 methyltransferase [Nakamurella panacisegetis]